MAAKGTGMTLINVDCTELDENQKCAIAKDNTDETAVFFVDKLEYIASAGIHTLVFAKQKFGVNVQVYLIRASDTILDVFH